MLSYGIAAQQLAPAPQPAPQPAPAKPSPVLLKVQLVISRHQGEKTISSHPYTLTVTADGQGANLRMGIKMPVPNTPFGPLPATPSEARQISWNYQDVGTSIDCNAKSLDGARYLLDMSVEDSWINADDKGSAVPGIPGYRSFRVSHETAILRDGQTTQLTTAADKATGETIRIDVTMNVVK